MPLSNPSRVAKKPKPTAAQRMLKAKGGKAHPMHKPFAKPKKRSAHGKCGTCKKAASKCSKCSHNY